MDILTFLRMANADAGSEKTGTLTPNVARIETTAVADDGQQYGIMLLDADDTFDVVVTWPNNEREIVWSLVRERTLDG